MPILPREQWPIECQRNECKGIFVGGCVERGDGSRFRAKAHAHWNGNYAGWLCFLSAKRLCARELVLHELAHLIAPGGHHDKWRTALVKLGGTLNAVPGLLKDYNKRTRK